MSIRRRPGLGAPPQRLPEGPGGALLGRYRLAERVGRGSTADVWRARDELLDRDVVAALGLELLAALSRRVDRGKRAAAGAEGP